MQKLTNLEPIMPWLKRTIIITNFGLQQKTLLRHNIKKRYYDTISNTNCSAPAFITEIKTAYVQFIKYRLICLIILQDNCNPFKPPILRDSDRIASIKYSKLIKMDRMIVFLFMLSLTRTKEA